MSINYNNSKVYKIWSPQGNKIYVGSTTKQYLSQRMTAHRKDYNLWKIGKCCLTTSYLLFDEYGLENCFIELLEAKPCSSRDELKQLEGGYIRNLTCVNKYIAGRTNKEWLDDNKEKVKNQAKEYHEANKEKIKEYQKEYNRVNKDKLKEYREINKDKIKEKKQSNQEKINARQRERRREKKLSLSTS